MESNLEGCLIVRKEGKVVAIGHNDLDKRVVVFYQVENQTMGLEEFQTLLDNTIVVK